MSLRRMENLTSYTVFTSGYDFVVTMERLSNDRNGNARYKATVSILTDHDKTGGEYTLDHEAEAIARVYTFTGHCQSERNEARWIAEQVRASFKR